MAITWLLQLALVMFQTAAVTSFEFCDMDWYPRMLLIHICRILTTFRQIL